MFNHVHVIDVQKPKLQNFYQEVCKLLCSSYLASYDYAITFTLL